MAIPTFGEWTYNEGQIERAVANYKKALFYNPNHPQLYNNLAAAYSAVGNFPEAIKTAEKALELARSSDQKKLTEKIQNRLLLYKASQPYREPSAAQGDVEP